MSRPWEWRKAEWGVDFQADREAGERIFHAYDVNDNAACEPSHGLVATCEPPNEGSRFCLPCMDYVRANPAGRDRRAYAKR